MPGWLLTAMLLILIQLTEMRPGGYDHEKQHPNIRHHHRHKHKHAQIMSDLPFEDTFFDPLKQMVIDKDMINTDFVSYRNVKNDWVNMSNDQVGELKDKKHHPHWPIKREAVIEGDLVLGGLMMVHERSDSMTCGPVMPQGGVQALETMLYTLDIVNNDLNLIPGVTIGAHVLDDCDKDTYGLEMAVDFIKGQ
ncbi:unnamed protein product [Diatraea saccharalis]|uniref:Receptor ligand binding region domain-containing protein n=1 Tax=Diatraea saccharalis TaxID=40085 RepID=A0A9N9W9R3_9NEOP|nr:unnamed protein product [Diatraea saccharalis]